MKITAKIELPDSLRPEVFRAHRAELKRLIRRTAYACEREMKVSMAGPKHGRTYSAGKIVRNRKAGKVVVGHKIRRASAPGEAPAVVTGHLRNSIRTIFENDGLTGIVTAHADYAAFLEGGTRKMSPRPFGRPALDKVRPAFDTGLGVVVNTIGG